jgi:hypothetical protein
MELTCNRSVSQTLFVFAIRVMHLMIQCTIVLERRISYDTLGFEFFVLAGSACLPIGGLSRSLVWLLSINLINIYY